MLFAKTYLNTETEYLDSVNSVAKPNKLSKTLKFLWPYHIGIKVMRAKSLKSNQILGAHMPYFCRPGHI